MKRITISVITLANIVAASVYAANPKALWDANCAQCHGADGSANTKMGKQLNAKDLTSAQVQASFTDADATKAIKDGVKQNGKTTMKAFAAKLSDDDIKTLAAYVRTLKK